MEEANGTLEILFHPEMWNYPDRPGWVRGSDTSKDAALSLDEKHFTEVQAKILSLYKAGRELTADEVANLLNESILFIRPRISELMKLGFLKDTGDRRPNDSGRNARVLTWRTR